MCNNNRNQPHAYNPDEIERLRRVSLPVRLKCGMCLRSYNQANFSQRQLTDVRYQVATTGRITKNPKCFKCTGGQPVEIECVICHKTKGLEGFAKTQRKRPDDARCYHCTEIQLAREPVNETAYEDPNKAFLRTESLSSGYPDYWAPTNSTCDTASSVGEYEDSQSDNGSRRRYEGGGINLSGRFQQAIYVSGDVSDTLIDPKAPYQSTTGPKPETWSEVAGTRSWHTGTSASSTAHSNFDPNCYGTSGADSVSGSVHSFNSSIAERSQTGSDRIEIKNGFARVRAYRPPQQEDPWANEDRNDSSSSSDDDDDCGDDDTVI